jgi:hypothetical protein
MNTRRQEIDNELYVINEYGVKHQNPAAKLSKETVDYYKKNYNINTELHNTCINCQIRQINKYGSEFEIKCSGIAKKLPEGSSAKLNAIKESNPEIDQEKALKILKATIDPVAWCELMFGFSDDDDQWFLRNYQKEQLRCTSKRVAVREGRRSGKSFVMALKLIYTAFNSLLPKGRDASGNTVNVGATIMVVTPYQAQLTNIFEEMEKLLKRNRELCSEVTTGTGDSLYIKTPTFKMEFRNGAVIQGFVSGIGMRQDGSGGGTMRGFSADLVYLDEMDMIPEDILDKVINPILATTPNTALIATSTPIGKQGKFYEWCLKRPDFKEDYLPSSVIPHWEQIKDEILREATKDSFAAEYMAIFIEEQNGIFKKDWVFKAMLDYSYADTTNAGKLFNKLGLKGSGEKITCIGIDWNKNAGTEFYVVGYYPSINMWIGLDAINVPASEYSAKRWIKELLQLNYKWKPDYIYADEGYGHTIIEDVKYQSYSLRAKKNKSAMDEQTVKIADRLVSFNFSSNVILKDPVTNKDIKKLGKHFLVENAIRTLEEGLFIFSSEDVALKNQFFNYKVLRRNPQNNKPVYGKANDTIGDHRLDAFMLALGGLVLEESVYSGRQMMPSVPTFHRTQVSGTGFQSAQDEIDTLFDKAQEQGFPGALNVLRIMRGNGSEEEERAIRQKYIDDGIIQERGNGNKSRSIKKDKDFSLLESLAENLNTPNSSKTIGSVYHTPKRGRFGSKSRSWRK